VKKLKLDEICIDGGTQTRAQINQDTIAEYAADMEAGHKFPDVVVFHDGKVYWLADGFHRVLAAERLTFKEINCDVRKGGKLDAIKYALSANTTNGLRRSIQDKRHCIAIALENWPKSSKNKIAELCGVAATMVADEMTRCSIATPDTVIGKDNKEYPAHKVKTAYTDATSSTVEPVSPVKVPDGEMPSATAMINKIEGKEEITARKRNVHQELGIPSALAGAINAVESELKVCDHNKWEGCDRKKIAAKLISIAKGVSNEDK